MQQFHPSTIHVGCLVAGLVWAAGAAAQVTVKPDGQWRHLFGAGASLSSGNSESSSFNLDADSVRATVNDKWSVTGRALYGKSEGRKTAERFSVGTQYERDFDSVWFGFGRLEAVRDRPANLSRRIFAGTGVGYHLARGDDGFWNVSMGFGYTQDRFLDPAEVDGRVRRSYGRAEVLLAQESSYQLTGTTNFKQKLSVLPNLEDRGEYRAEFESALSVAITQQLSLTAGLTVRYNSDPGEGLERTDMGFVTGVAVRID
ncbi:MAG TPA: DUF481 domain-containing protein [Burkholderiaceae bacterium]|nr:DUF481 domain-containing protein [Burkholderiaceae bacterium]